MEVLQQGWPGPPHVPVLQLPLRQVPCKGRQLASLATQMLAAQQPLSAQELPGQHTCPGPPQVLEATVVAELADVLPPLETVEAPPLALLPPALPAFAELAAPAWPPEEDVVLPESPPPAPPLPVSVLFSTTPEPPPPVRPPVRPPPPVKPPPLVPPSPITLSEDLHADKATAHTRTVRDKTTEDAFTVPCFSMLRLLDWREPS